MPVAMKTRYDGIAPASVQVCPNAVLAAFALIGLVFVVRLGALGALMFLGSGLLLVVRHPRTALAELRGYALLWPLALWCLASVFWSNYPDLTMRYSVQLILSFAIAIAMANRLSPLAFLKVVLVVYLLAGLASLGFNRVRSDGIWLGIFASKNALAQVASVLLVAGFAMVIDRARGVRWRSVGLVALTLGALLVLKAHSAGNLIAVFVALITVSAIFLMRRASAWQRLFLLIFTLLSVVMGVLLIVGFFDEFAQIVLQLTGKNVTLTGRTELWSTAFAEIAERPLLGQGYSAVWVRGNPLAEELWLRFGIASKTGFHFHNTLISNAVEIGLIGIALQAAMFFWGLYAVLRWALSDPRAETYFLAGLMMRQLLLSMTEVVYFIHFSPVTILTLAAIVYALRQRRAARRSTPESRIAPERATIAAV